MTTVSPNAKAVDLPLCDTSDPASLEAGWHGRFWKFVEKTGDCWLWRGSTAKAGYGQFGMVVGRNKWKPFHAHRISWMLANGTTPPAGMFVLHSCDVKACVNPSHLHLGTHAMNMAEASARKRFNPNGKKTQTHCKRGHPLSGENLFVGKQGYRQCRTCRALSDRAIKAKRRLERAA